jgi:hypothetical protein
MGQEAAAFGGAAEGGNLIHKKVENKPCGRIRDDSSSVLPINKRKEVIRCLMVQQ